MFAVIDCGTSNTRVYIVSKRAADRFRRRALRRRTQYVDDGQQRRAGTNGLTEAIKEAIAKAGITEKDVSFAIASGMITSEIGLMEIPHLVAPIGLDQLAANVKLVPGNEIVPLDIPIMFVRGVRNDYGDNATLRDIRKVDFMRGEETQMIGVMMSTTSPNRSTSSSYQAIPRWSISIPTIRSPPA